MSSRVEADGAVQALEVRLVVVEEGLEQLVLGGDELHLPLGDFPHPARPVAEQAHMEGLGDVVEGAEIGEFVLPADEHAVPADLPRRFKVQERVHPRAEEAALDLGLPRVQRLGEGEHMWERPCLCLNTAGVLNAGAR